MILVTGASGTLGTALVPRLVGAGAKVWGLSRRPRPAQEGLVWVNGDLETGAGLHEAVGGADVIVHAASDGKPTSADADNARRLIDAVRGSGGSPHLVYISIVGVDAHPFGYYRAKHATEQLIVATGLPYTILRTTQWHQLLDRYFGFTVRMPLVPVPARTAFQPIDVSEVAARLAELAVGEPAGRVEDMGGPQVRDAAELARGYLRAARRRRPVVPVRIPGATGRGFREGLHMAPGHTQGTITWEDFLARRFS